MYRILTVAFLLVWGCNVGDDPPLVAPPANNQNNTNNQPDMSADMSEPEPDMSDPDMSEPDMPEPDMPLPDPCDTCTDDQVCFEEACCTPLAPEACSEEQCGMVSDGCGGMVDCGVCTCTTTNFETFCPSRPCEVVTGCENEECTYAPLECAGLACDCPGGNCDDTSLRDCRDAGALTCPAHHCDPSPSTGNDGTVTYANVCVEPPGAVCDFTNLCVRGECNGSSCDEAPCGLCNLGRWDCADGTLTPTCYDIPETSTPMAQTNCNDNSAQSTFIYVDHVAGTDAVGSGSKAQPFLTFAAGMAAAIDRGAKGLVVREGLVLNQRLDIENGISIYGGYSGVPNWKLTENGRLTVVNSVPQAGGHVIAARAQDITERTVLNRLSITSGSASASGASSYGLHAMNSPGLVIQDSVIASGNGGAGTGGLNGVAGTSGGGGATGGIGSNVSVSNGGARGVNNSCSSAHGGNGGRGGYGTSFSGVPGATSPAGNSGGAGGGFRNPGSNGASTSFAILFPGSDGAAGTADYAIQNSLWINNGNGVAGGTGAAGRGGGGGGGGGGDDVGFAGTFNGGGGGGGGAGGCAGTGGSRGLAGGGSFGVFAIDSTGIQVIDSSVTSGNAGNGGRGGTAGNGGSGGAGGNGGAQILNSGFGGRGGNGQNGSRGGHGGGGAGGISVGIYCENSQITPDPSATVVAGARGNGGVSAGADGEPGFRAELHQCQ